MLLVLAVSVRGAAEPPGLVVTEADAVRRVLARPGVGALVEGAAASARGEAIEAGLPANPVLSYDREQVFGGAAGGSDDFVALSQTLDLGGRRSLRADAGDERVRAAVHRGAQAKIELAAAARRSFCDVLHALGRVTAARAWAAHVDEAQAVVLKRAAAGDVSAYDHRRLLRERATAEARLGEELAALWLAQARLAGMMGEDAAAEVLASGELLPAAPGPDLQELLTRLPRRPDLQELAAEEAAARLEQRAAERGWVPDVTLSAGLKTTRVVDERGWGFLAGVAIPLPFASYGQGEAARAAGRERLAGARHQLVLAEARAEVLGLQRQVDQLVETARTFRRDAVVPSDELAKTAEAAYRGGEVGVLELLDAWRSVLDASLQVLDLEAAARRARIELDRTVGEDL